ncbi:IS630 family transposase, partial [bacterium]|nr:IS630 family transposase [bacterium]
MKIKDARSLSPTAQEALRIRAVNAVIQGKKRSEVAKLFCVAPFTLRKWMRLYQEGGKKALKAKKQGRPRRIQLKPLQAALTVRLITDRLPDQMKLPFALWTRDAVAQLIEQKFGLRLSRWTVGRYLKRWGFTPQKPARRAFEQDPLAVNRWLEVEYPEIKLQAKQKGAQIHWGDEAG